VAVIATILVACSGTPPAHDWADQSAHLVDGIWLTSEHPCQQSGLECEVDVEAALEAVDPLVVVAAATAGLPTSYKQGDQTILMTFGGLTHPSAVVFDLADSSRRVVLLTCGGPVTDGKVVTEPRECFRNDAPWVHEGREPWVAGGF
jgi:hypothetical protein